MSRIEDGGAVEAGLEKLVERLRNAPFPNGWTQHPETLDIAEVVLDAANRIEDDAAEITRLRAENAGMREALKPFAFERSALDLSRYDDENQVEVRYPPVGRHQRIPVGRVTIGDLRRARAALSNSSQAEGQTR